jgi:hypothetical protein
VTTANTYFYSSSCKSRTHLLQLIAEGAVQAYPRRAVDGLPHQRRRQPRVHAAPPPPPFRQRASGQAAAAAADAVTVDVTAEMSALRSPCCERRCCRQMGASAAGACRRWRRCGRGLRKWRALMPQCQCTSRWLTANAVGVHGPPRQRR